MTPQELKNSILQLAIQGKLVEQRPEEGTAEDLYRQIQREKQALIKAGKIKKEKPLPEITEDEIPFEIPESWKWVRIAEITTSNPKNVLDDDLEVAFIPMPCVSDGYRNAHTFEIRKWKDIKTGFTHFADKDIGVAKITPCFQNRKSVIFQNLKNGYGAGTTELSIIRVINDSVSRKYLLWFFKTEYFISNGVKSFTGTAGQQRIHKDYLFNCLMPLPPLAEQKRIVAKIEELLPYIDRYEKAWNRLEDFNKRFPADMQKSILQLAIQGKLVEQRPEEGTGEALYQQIQKEKQALIKAGKIKKEKPMLEITEDEIPFEIPESWKWTRLIDIAFLTSGNQYNEQDRGIPYLKVADMNLPENRLEITTSSRFTSAENQGMIPSYSIIFPKRGGAIATNKKKIVLKYPVYIDSNSMGMTVIDKNIFDYIKIWFYSIDLGKLQSGTSVPQINNKDLYPLLVPLPPLAEQKRIVAKLEELLPLCERLK